MVADRVCPRIHAAPHRSWLESYRHWIFDPVSNLNLQPDLQDGVPTTFRKFLNAKEIRKQNSRFHLLFLRNRLFCFSLMVPRKGSSLISSFDRFVE